MGDGSFSDQAVTVTPAMVRQTGVTALRIAENLRSAVASVGGDVDTVLGSWRGGAADAYGAGWEDLRDGAQRIVAALNDLGELYGWVADTYEHRDAQSSDAFGSLRVD